MRTMKRLSFNRTHRPQSKSSSPIALVMPKRSDRSRTHFHRTCVVGLFRTRFLRALSHANFRNARPIGLSQRLPNKLFCVHFHSTSRKSLHGKPERADAAQTMSRFCKKWQKFAVVNGLGTPKRPQRCFVLGLSRSLCKSFHRNLSILALMPSSHSSWLRTRAQPGWWHPSPHLE